MQALICNATQPHLSHRSWSTPLKFDRLSSLEQAKSNPAALYQISQNASRFGVLVNQKAGRFAALGRTRLECLLARTNLSANAQIVYCEGEDLAKRARELAKSGVDAVAIYGGDGSARSVIEALSHTDIPVLPLPGGTLNRLCHRVHGHAHLKPILAKLAQARPIWLSGGRANEHLFLVAAGFGPWMAFEHVREVARHSGVKAGLGALRHARHTLFDGELALQGLSTSADIIVAAPGSVDGAFGLGIKETSLVSDRGLEVVAARLGGYAQAVGLGVQVLAHRWRNLDHVTTVTGDNITLTRHGGAPVSPRSDHISGLVDGEVCILGSSVLLTYHARAARVLTTR